MGFAHIVTTMSRPTNAMRCTLYAMQADATLIPGGRASRYALRWPDGEMDVVSRQTVNALVNRGLVELDGYGGQLTEEGRTAT